MLANTPRAYANAVQKYPVSDPRRRVAAARAVLAYRAAQAQQSGDYATASRALYGLGKLAALGDVDTAAIARNITRDLTTASGRLTPDARAVATGQRVSSIIGLVSSIISPIMGLITAAINDPGLTRAWNWAQVVLRGDVAPSFGESDLRLMASACSVWNGGAKAAVQGVAAAVEASVRLATIGADASTSVDANLAIQIVNSIVRWVVTALDTICNNLATVFPPASLEPTCGAAGQPPAPRAGMPPSSAGCCAGLSFDRGVCIAPTPTSPDAMALHRFQQAWWRRRNTEAFMSVGNEAQKATARADDASTAAALCAAGQELLAFRSVLPQMPRDGAPVPINTTNVLTVSATLFSPQSTRPYCSIAVRPASCPAGCAVPTSSFSGGGGGAGIFAVALPAAALVWYMMK